MTWDDAAPIAAALHQRWPRRDPLTLRFPDLERWAREIPGFDPGTPPSPEQLEAIQAAWYARTSLGLAASTPAR